MTEPVADDRDGCPGCGATSGVQRITDTAPNVDAWACTACEMRWAVTVVNPRGGYFERLAATMEELGAVQSVLRQVITLADDSAEVTNAQLRDRLTALADGARYCGKSGG